ncbi:MAG: HAD family hydrolase [Ruminococcaceae bacterium]|nr:HAD family hydrolase [Oscillospiraceae bacterium]
MKHILFDLDGTLTDSGEGIMHCAELTLDYYRLPIPSRSDMRSMVGPPLRDSFLRFGIPTEELDNAVAYYRKHYLAVGQYENAPYPGIPELLQKLLNDGHKLHLATSKPETMARDILKHFDLLQYFSIVCGAVAGERSTKEEVIAHLLTQLDFKDNLVMVGDTIYDVRGAAHHGIPCIAVSWGYGIANDMAAAGAAVVNSAQELYDTLQ